MGDEREILLALKVFGNYNYIYLKLIQQKQVLH